MDTRDVADLKRGLDAIGGRVITSVSMGYLAMLELSMSFRSSEDIAAFKAALAANPVAFDFLKPSKNDNNDATEGNTSGVGQTQNTNNERLTVYPTHHKADLNALNRLAVHLQRSKIHIDINCKMLQRGKLRDEIPMPPGAWANLGLVAGNISSLFELSKAYNSWIGQNQGKEIEISKVVGVDSSPISSFPCYQQVIGGFRHEDQVLSLQSAKALLVQQLNQRNKTLYKFVKMIQSSAKKQQEKEQDIMKLLNKNASCFQSLINDRFVLDRYGNQLIHYASFFDLSALITRLVSMGADINSRNARGMTSLMIVARNGYLQSLEAVLRARPYLELEDNNGWTALTHASSTSDNGLKIIGAIAATAAVAAAATAAMGGDGSRKTSDPEKDKRQQPNSPNPSVGMAALGREVAALGVIIALAGRFCHNVELPDYQCQHIFYCNHSRTKSRLREVGANKEKACSSLRTGINTVANVFCLDWVESRK